MPDLDRPLPLHPLVYLEDGDDVTVGRRDIESYAVFPPDGAELVRRIADGETPARAATWYERHYGEPVDIDDVVEVLHDLDFVRAETPEDATPATTTTTRVRWQRLGQILFSRPAMLLYAALIAWAVYAALRSPDLRPTFRHIFYTEYYSLIQATLFVAALPLLLLHESFHALAGRRLGLPSRLSIGRRLYFIVLETSMDSLVTVPRRQRYLPILAGMLADVLAVAALTTAADLTRAPDGALSLTGRFCLAVSFATLLRIAWQFSFYLRTDLYVLASTVLGCVDLHAAVRGTLRNRVNRLLRRPHRLVDESTWHPVDRRVAHWYAWLVPVGYAISLTTFALALAPVTWFMFKGVLTRFSSGGTPLQVLDSSVFLAFSLIPIAVYGLLALRDRRRGKGRDR
ncbi:hypothetical protein KCV87_06195 [Actinosynnema pretiosum subsp. pretiosum]|uniref:PqqD family protein n=1 Tax=Actinosynnema pretiosum subsp. pretiosum TaxID=103721 RepID=A0AA45LAC2_9PSEU|nr:hypothetical protein APASM_2791 [Actinosynnema pretiosum subsp. pretiosum]QUF05683.1 hypothetical protein KCV87_06195 [Actinosynnema pretiosum subsp. pretiosum]